MGPRDATFHRGVVTNATASRSGDYSFRLNASTLGVN
jgi:hypothetical protein